MARLSTRSIDTAQAIADRKPFTTSGALEGRVIGSRGAWYSDSGQLSGVDLAQWRNDVAGIRYVVVSYSTPIAWWVAIGADTGRWYRVGKRFSITTSRHQGNLYMITVPEHKVSIDTVKRGDHMVHCTTCGYQSHHTRIDAARESKWHHEERGLTIDVYAQHKALGI